MHRGSCLCGAVSFEVEGELPPPDACHCTQCRKQSGHSFASTDVKRQALTVIGADRINWFRSSVEVQRGFCSRCGSALFWDPIGKDRTGIAMGAFDKPTGTQLRGAFTPVRKLPCGLTLRLRFNTRKRAGSTIQIATMEV